MRRKQILILLLPVILAGCSTYTRNIGKAEWSDGGSVEAIEVGTIDLFNQNMKVVATKTVVYELLYYAQNYDGSIRELNSSQVSDIKFLAGMENFEPDQLNEKIEVGSMNYMGQEARVFASRKKRSEINYFATNGNGFFHQLAPAAVAGVAFYAGMEALEPDQTNIENNGGDVSANAEAEGGRGGRGGNSNSHSDSYSGTNTDIDIDVDQRNNLTRPKPTPKISDPKPAPTPKGWPAKDTDKIPPPKKKYKQPGD